MSTSTCAQGPPSGLHLCRPCVYCHSLLGSHLHQPRYVQKALFPCCLPSLLVLTTLPPPLLQSSLSPAGRDLMEMRHLGLRVPRSLLIQYPSVGLSVPICFWRKLLWWCPSNTPIYEDSRMSSGIILVLWSFSRTVVFDISVGLWPIWPQDIRVVTGVWSISWSMP